MGYECYQVIRFESKHHNNFNDFEKNRFSSLHDIQRINFYLNSQNKEIAEVLLGRRSLECPVNDISGKTDWEELNLFYNIWVMGFGKNTSYKHNLFFYINNKFNCYGQPIFEFNRIRIYADKKTFDKYSRKSEITRFQDLKISTTESELIFDFFKNGKYSFGSAGIHLFDINKIDSLYQIYGYKGMIINPDFPPVDIKNKVIKKMFSNKKNIDAICSEFMDLILKIEISYNNDVIFYLSLRGNLSKAKRKLNVEIFLF